MRNAFSRSILMTAMLMLAGCLEWQTVEPQAQIGGPEAAAPPSDWREAEKGILANQIQLTFSDRFVKAGESYFSPDDKKIIFQAVEKPQGGGVPDEFYAMFIADVQRDSAGMITGIDHIKRLSPKGSANTCGWFHPIDRNVVLFASTLTKPTQASPPGYQRASGRYKWAFPPEMRIVRCELDKADGTAATLQTLVGNGTAYCAEDSLSADGRHLLYCSLESGEGDLFILDLKTKRKTCIVQAKGYDGGPFFSPDGKRICYRSDRNGDNLLQLFVADLAFNENGEIVGIKREFQLTDDASVNWCPFWTPEGRHLIYASSELGERNFEIFMLDADPGDLPGSTGTIKYGTAKRRLTYFDQAGAVPASDVLPALSHDGKWMIWSSRRGPDHEVHLWAAQLLLNPDIAWKPQPEQVVTPQRRNDGNQITITDPDTGRIFIYDLGKHTLSEYHMDSHTLTEVTDPELLKKVTKLYEAQKAQKKPQ